MNEERKITLPEKPERLISFGDRNSTSASGFVYELEKDVWQIAEHVTIYWRDTASYFNSQILFSIKSVINILAQSRSPTTPKTVNYAFNAFAKAIDKKSKIEFITSEDIVKWALTDEVYKYAILKMGIDVWKNFGYFGLDDEGFETFESIQVPDRSEADAVVSWHPTKGAYRPVEDQLLKTALNDSFNEGKTSLSDYTLARLMRAIGLRPAQAAIMKLSDVRKTSGSYEIRIPMVKQRALSRSQFMPWKPIPQGLGSVLEMHISENVESVADSAESRVELLPLFPKKRARSLVGFEDLTEHQSGDSLGKTYRATFERIGTITSPISNMKIVINARRDRHTVGTSLAHMGCTASEIAANLGQTNPASADKYVDASIEHNVRVESSIGDAVQPMADRFMGVITESKADDSPLEARILNREMDGLGSCGIGGCGAIEANAAPFACYVCRKFRAWADGPHEQFLQMTLADHDRLKEAGDEVAAVAKIETIVAMNDVIEACHNYNAKMTETDNG